MAPKPYFLHTPQELLGRIKANFPQLDCTTYKYIDEGWDHQVIIIDNSLVFRFPDDQEYLDRLVNEIAVLKRLKPLVKLQIPDYTHIAKDGSFAGYPMLPGQPLFPKLFDSLAAVDQTQIVQQLADLLSTLHNLIAQGHNFDEVEPSSMIEEQAKLKLVAQQDLPTKLNPADMLLVHQIIQDTDQLLKQPLPAVFIHGDIYSRHILWNAATEQLGVIDFSDMNRGDPAFDFAELYEYGPAFVQQIYQHYHGPKDSSFLGRAWLYQQWTSLYLMADHFETQKTSFTQARQTFDRVKN